jgi:hypothetical protein
VARPAAEDAGQLRWCVEQRLAFVEERLFWVGEVNRTDLVRRFGVSMSQASGDIGRYLALAPPGLTYNKSAKRYVAGEGFRPVLAEPDAKRFLGELRPAELGILPAEDTIFGALPSFSATPVPERAVDAMLLRAMLRVALGILYQSMSRPGPARRVIEPHALAYDGFRWHARAFDRESGEFRDFVLGRASKPKAEGPARANPESDRALAHHHQAGDRAAPRSHARAGARHRDRLQHSRRLRVAPRAAGAPVLRPQAAGPRRLGRRPTAARAAHRAAKPRRGEQENEPKPADLERIADSR